MAKLECVNPECSYCHEDLSDVVGFLTSHDCSITWCPFCGERLRPTEDRLIDEAVYRAEMATERALGIR